MKIVVYDNSEWAGLVSNTWPIGGRIFTALRAVDQVHGVSSFDEFFSLMSGFGDGEVTELQFWGHGRPGGFSINSDSVGTYMSSTGEVRLSYGSRFADMSRVLDKSALFWLRTCSSFHGNAGHAFAKELTEVLGRRCAAHTYMIGPLQSGLHSLRPGETPTWSTSEGLDSKTGKVKMSGLFDPHTVTCLHASFNKKW